MSGPAVPTGAGSSSLAPRPPDDPTYDVDPGRGWIAFAGAVLALAGVLNVVHGIAAISNSKVFARDAVLVTGSLKTWGWLLLGTGIVQVCTAGGIWAAREWARWLGVLAVGVNMLVLFIVLPAHPGFAGVVFFVDVIVLYGLLTYGGVDRRSLADLN